MSASQRKREQQQSFKTDKAVADNIVESWVCIDCGVNTAPGFPSGPDVRIALKLGGKASFHIDTDSEIYDVGKASFHIGTDSEIYDVRDDIWKAAGMRPWNGCLCIGCLERRIGRELRPRDFSPDDARVWAQTPCTDRLLDRRGVSKVTFLTDEGEREMIIDKQSAAKLKRHLKPGELPRLHYEEDE